MVKNTSPVSIVCIIITLPQAIFPWHIFFFWFAPTHIFYPVYMFLFPQI